MLKEKGYSLDFSAALPWLCMTSCGFNAQDLLSCKETVVHRRERDSISNPTRVFIYYYRIGQQCAKNINYLMALNCISWADFPQTNFKFNFPNVFRKCLLPSSLLSFALFVPEFERYSQDWPRSRFHLVCSCTKFFTLSLVELLFSTHKLQVGFLVHWAWAGMGGYFDM